MGKSDSIKNLPNPKNISELRSFFGSINQYMKFVANLSSLSSLLRPLLAKKSHCSSREVVVEKWLFFARSGLAKKSHCSSRKPLLAKKSVYEIRPESVYEISLRNQYMKFVPNLSSLSSLLRPLLAKKSVYQWNDDYTKAFEELKQQIVNITWTDW